MRAGPGVAIGLLMILAGWFLTEFDPSDFSLQFLVAMVLLAGGAAVLVSVAVEYLGRKRR